FGGCRSVAVLTVAGVQLWGGVVLHPLPPRLLPEHGAMRGVPGVGGRDPQWAARGALAARRPDVVVALVVLDHPPERVAGRAVLRTEPPDVHVPQGRPRIDGEDPRGSDHAR